MSLSKSFHMFHVLCEQIRTHILIGVNLRKSAKSADREHLISLALSINKNFLAAPFAYVVLSDGRKGEIRPPEYVIGIIVRCP